MDQNWLNRIDKNTAVIVPTRSLLSDLSERIAQHNLAQGKLAWEAPNLFTWQDFLQHLWLANKHRFEQPYRLLSSRQSSLLWTRVIDQSKRNESALTLLNVQQSVRSVARSWALMNDWNIAAEHIQQDDSDSKQFRQWLAEYQHQLEKNQFLDTALLPKALLNKALLSKGLSSPCEIGFKQIIWHAYDLKTQSQYEFDHYAQANGVEISQSDESLPENLTQSMGYHRYQSPEDEIRQVLSASRELLEQKGLEKQGFEQRINIVIPNLQHSLPFVERLAKEEFYSDVPPLESLNQAKIYRFSLGKVLEQWPAINTALRIITLLKNRINVVELNTLLRNPLLGIVQSHQAELTKFSQYLTQQKHVTVYLEQLPNLLEQARLYEGERRAGEQVQEWPETGLRDKLQQLLELYQQMRAQSQENQYSSLPFTQWASLFQQWLACWGWLQVTVMNTSEAVEFQLSQRWENLLQEFTELALVQQTVGINRSIELIQQMAREVVFLPKAPASPILISGIYEAIGQQADVCFLTGMTENFPESASKDSFIPNSLLQQQGYPEATTNSSFEQAKKVQKTLLAFNKKVMVSYAQFSGDKNELEFSVSPLYRQQSFIDVPSIKLEQQKVELETYMDFAGQEWNQKFSVKGGSKIFENQSSCPFKAYATHQLNIGQEYESEFGLDAMERGNIAHHLLQQVWDQLKTQQALLVMDALMQFDFCSDIVKQFLAENTLGLSEEKFELLQLEGQRLTDLLDQWLEQDRNRPAPFTVKETERKRPANIGGISFNYIIDRVDELDDGRLVVVDYKTGNVSRSQWTGDRIEQPQLPLYSQALEHETEQDIAGIAFAKVKNQDCVYENLSEAEIFKSKPRADWDEHHSKWPLIFDQLAQDFLAGNAEVNPIKPSTCQYCEIKPMCRIAQLRQQAGELMEAEDE